VVRCIKHVAVWTNQEQKGSKNRPPTLKHGRRDPQDQPSLHRTKNQQDSVRDPGAFSESSEERQENHFRPRKQEMEKVAVDRLPF
jgi:hypothetical protein